MQNQEFERALTQRLKENRLLVEHPYLPERMFGAAAFVGRHLFWVIWGMAGLLASVTMGLMLVVLMFLVLSAFNFDNLLSVANIGGKGEQENEEPAPEQVTEEPTLDAEVARQLLGFVDYPVVKVRPTVISLFSPEAR